MVLEDSSVVSLQEVATSRRRTPILSLSPADNTHAGTIMQQSLWDNFSAFFQAVAHTRCAQCASRGSSDAMPHTWYRFSSLRSFFLKTACM